MRGRFALNSLGAFGITLANVGLLFATRLLLARVLGVADYGIFAYVVSWGAVLELLAVFGLGQIIIREVAQYCIRSEWGNLKGLLLWSDRAVLLTSTLLIGATVTILWLLHLTVDQPLILTFGLMLLGVPFMAINRLRFNALCGLQHIVLGLVPLWIVQPVLLIMLVALTYILVGFSLDASWVMGLRSGSLVVAFVLSAGLLQHHLPPFVKQSRPVYTSWPWLKSALPLLFIAGMNLINTRTDILMLGTMQGYDAAGIYDVAVQVAKFVIFSLLVMQVVVGPMVANLYARSQLTQIQRLITTSSRLMLLFAVPLVVAFVGGGNYILRLFGSEFVSGQVALVILSVGQLVNAATGLAGLVLIMAGYENDTAVAIGSGAVLNVILNAILIPQWGINGAAVATASSTAFWNLMLVVQVWRRLNIDATALGWRRVNNGN